MIHMGNIKGVAWQYFAKFYFMTEQICEICENKVTRKFPVYGISTIILNPHINECTCMLREEKFSHCNM